MRETITFWLSEHCPADCGGSRPVGFTGEIIRVKILESFNELGYGLYECECGAVWATPDGVQPSYAWHEVVDPECLKRSQAILSATKEEDNV